MNTAAATASIREASTHADASMPHEPFWYRNAVIYQMHVRSFADSNGDGIGDFNGLISKLDYLEDLGITAIWLLPFYPSPLRDDGYDIGDYTNVNPSYGTIDDARRFIEEAHRRGIRVITELVINHTSDQHEWFQRARKAPKGSPERDFYVWSDTPEKYAGVRIIFKDFEPSNWTFDHEAGQYYWHRFFHHQPDLNFDNPAVHQAVFDVLDFWMQAGVDGLRLDAVPYLYEREGTSCENLPETHGFLKKLRTYVDEKWPGRMLLAEANQWPEDAIAYFGQGEGDECHMNFHFPLMPRLFMALRMEDRYPIIDILEQTPPIPATSQWAMFLRNHDELTLEMVTDEERDYMWRVYASDPVARINLGIRRRLAPLLENNRRKIELLNTLLFSMPGTPVIYYGDEIGMGDNIFLGDRNGVRTPMQWSADRNAGFSRASGQRLFLPPIAEAEYSYEAVNVETQLANTSSLLWWTKRLIALRKQHPVLGRGDIKFLSPSNGKVLAFLRRDETEHVLVVANLSRFAQPVELDLSEYAGSIPVELAGGVAFPVVRSDGHYVLSLAGHTAHVFAVKPMSGTSLDFAVTPEVKLNITGRTVLDDARFHRLLEARLPRLLPTRRWFVGKARTIRSAQLVDQLSFSAQEGVERVLFLAEVEFADGDPEIYALPLAASLATEPVEGAPVTTATEAIMNVTDGTSRRWRVVDGMADETFARELLDAAQGGRRIDGESYRLTGRRIGSGPRADDIAALPVRLSTAEQSNSNVIFGDRVIFKLYRRLGEGVNPELEVGEHLTVRAGFAHTAPVAGTVEISRGGRTDLRTLGVVLGFVPNQGDAWAAFLDHASRYYERFDALTPEQVEAVCFADDAVPVEGTAVPPPEVGSLIAEPLEWARLLGQRTAEMHIAMADAQRDPAFAPEPFSLMFERSLLQSMRNTTRATMNTLDVRMSMLGGEALEMATQLRSREADLLKVFRHVSNKGIRGSRIRNHGDYHLGQVLWTGKDFVIVDFEGEPLRPVSERRLKRSPLRDAAGMIRSFDYAAWAALREHRERLPMIAAAEGKTLRERDRRGGMLWAGWLRHEFLRGYLATMHGSKLNLLPAEPREIELLLRTRMLEKALYEVRYELNARPDWVEVPLRAVLDLLAAAERAPDGSEPTPCVGESHKSPMTANDTLSVQGLAAAEKERT